MRCNKELENALNNVSIGSLLCFYPCIHILIASILKTYLTVIKIRVNFKKRVTTTA